MHFSSSLSFFSSLAAMRSPMSCSSRWTRLLGFLLCCFFLAPSMLSAASRDYFVSATTGAYAHNASSWTQAKNNLQEAINMAWDAIQKNQITEANIYVAAGTYIPSEVAEESGNSVLHTSFKLYPGIHVYGGYKGDETNLDPSAREKKTDETGKWAFVHETILSGDHTSRQNGVIFDWNEVTHTYTTSSLSSSYHVLWFATEGFHPHPVGQQPRAKALRAEAVVDGCIISGGSAGYREDHSPHGYGGGAYLTAGSVVRNCVFRRNAAVRGGGAVFLDGGGVVEDCYLVMNQTLGVGTVDGNGGALMAWGNEAEVGKTALARRCVMANNVGRNGGAAYLRTSSARKYDAALSGCILVRNVATSEAGGAYLDGGVMNHCTVVRNACYGTGVVIDAKATGRSAGVFVAGEATLFNSVLWGGRVEANNHLQIANALTANQRAHLYYSGIQGYEQSDWTGFERTESFDLSVQNSPAAGQGDNFAEFAQLAHVQHADATAAGIFKELEINQGGNLIKVKPADYWKYFSSSLVPSSTSDLRAKSVRLRDFAFADYDKVQYADLDEDFDANSYSGRTTLGAFVAKHTPFAAVEQPSIAGGGNVKTIFVDTERKPLDGNGKLGTSWDNALDNLADALQYAETLGEPCQVLVKQGIYTPRPTDAGRMRENSFRLASNVRLYGGFKSELTGVAVADRNPVAYATILSGAIVDKNPNSNVAHVVSIEAAQDVVLDGVKVEQGNTAPDVWSIYTPQQQVGAGIYIHNHTTSPATMTGIRIQNVIVAHNRAATAAAIAIENPQGGAVVTMTNTIVHNNTATHTTPDERSAIEVAAGTTLVAHHSNILQNVGHPIVADGGSFTLTNSQVWANARDAHDNFMALQGNDAARALLKTENNGTIAGSGNLLDHDETMLASDLTNKAILTYSETVGNDLYTFPKVNNPVVPIGASTLGDLTLLGGDADFTPANVNPVVNAATSNANQTDISGVARDFGGVPDVGAKENQVQHKVVEGVLYVRGRDGDNRNDGQTWGRAFKTIRYALEVARDANFATPGTVKKIYVAAGTYPENTDGTATALTLVPGVDVLGGFLAYGNPLFQEGDRSVANDSIHFDKYRTIIDGERKGRVLTGEVANAATKTTWEGFTFQYGKTTGRDYGAGVLLKAYNVLKNCLVQNNHFKVSSTTESYQGGGGIYAGQNSVVQNSIIRFNFISPDAGAAASHIAGGGVYIAGATFINSLVTDNRVDYNSFVLGAAGYVRYTSKIYNCTFAYNFAKSSGPTLGGVWDASGNSKFVNCIFWGNGGHGSSFEDYMQAGVSGAGGGGGVPAGFKNCYQSAYNKVTKSDQDDPNYVFYTHPGVTETDRLKLIHTDEAVNEFLRICRENQPFDENYNLLPSSKSQLSRYCINSGVEEYDGVKFLVDNNIEEDIVGADRIQDCRIDKGAYEYNGAYDIKPTLDVTAGSPTEGAYIYYVNEKGGGQASASSVTEAACAIKLQKVLDAAGRFVLEQMAYNRESDNKAERVPRVIVKLAGHDTQNNAFDQETFFKQSTTFTYKPTRAITPARENPRDFAFIVPHGVEVWGGYSNNFGERDFKKYPTTLNGQYQTKDNTNVNCYHILHFTNDTFDAQEKKRVSNISVAFDEQLAPGKSRPRTKAATGLSIYALDYTPSLNAADNPNLKAQLDSLGRAVIDGIFLLHGQATGSAADDRRGGAAILPNFAHICNCVVRDDEAANEGGAFYLKGDALISGTILTRNRAEVGGALYVADDAGHALAQRAKVYTSTIVKNEATERGGGLVYKDNVLVNSSVLWQNTALLQANVSGELEPFNTPGQTLNQTDSYYYLSYTAVENFCYPGLNNFAVSSDNDKGVRFVANDAYYLPAPHSILVRNGLPTQQYKGLVRDWKRWRSASHDLVDKDLMAVSRRTYNNSDKGFIEIGARAYAGNMLAVPTDQSKLLRRLYVARSEELNPATVNALQTNGGDIYSQPGSSQGYPFQKLDDALEYVRQERKQHPDKSNTKFEIIVGRGIFLPHRTVKGVQGYGRTNTFLIPEGVSLLGGFNNAVTTTTFEGQAPDATTASPAGYTIQQKDAATLLANRPQLDVDANNIIEPWEFANQTILSGKVVNTSSNDQFNVYHVVMALANPDYVGTLPTQPAPIVIDGLTISDGYAYEYEPGDTPDNRPNVHTFYRGGAIAVVGNHGQNDAMKPDIDALPTRNIPLVVRRSQLLHNVGGWAVRSSATVMWRCTPTM